MWGEDSWEGWGSPGCWWQIKQKRPHATPGPALSPSPLTPVMGTGILKWVATAKCIIFEVLSHKPSWPHLQLCLMLFMSLPHPSLYLLCLIVCHLPVKWAASRGQAFHLSVSAAINWEWQHQKRKRRGKNGLKWSALGQLSHRLLYDRLPQRRGLNCSASRFPFNQMGIQCRNTSVILDFLPFPLSFPKRIQISSVRYCIFDFAHDGKKWLLVLIEFARGM